ncbi:aldehyde dehydrogenase [Peribacillus castrilensis]|uniref:Aldehyde dehydrogenase n=1 Tax=Peribacillus simplex TaxID=1478 RepID=A0AAN2TTK7_9BACI|nr:MULTISPECIES: aldehyde dehydrogenase [Bacillaceae]MCF7621954.1 aldehyde dehydrogenase [Peribacillus frigoritolerans]MCP1156162.1 aldehyde dehydrogenase [Peribacillus frigoritolerans]MCT1391551.1 aldehyde dehydrogenase [Peribacillus frigoritolerans]PAL11296.1 carnitine dehydratase [Peribacillus simplex]PRA86324.1 carnitine dehydratase [Peribacillus simplex]
MTTTTKTLYELPFTGVKEYKMFINNQWVESASGETFDSVNPFTGEVWAKAPKGEKEDIDLAVKAAKAAFETGEWSKVNGAGRAALLRKLGDLIGENAEILAISEVVDNGKLIREMLGQTKSLSGWCYYFAGLADKIHGESIPVDIPNMINYTVREPLGVVGAIIPWNSPLLLTLFKLGPALAAGNTMVIKPSEVTPASLLELAKLIEEAGFPPGVVNIVTGFGHTAGDALAKHPDVRKIAFTGSSATGKLIVKNSAEHFARVSLELGGKSPNIIFEDANLPNAVNGVLAGIFAASGQTCMAGSRVLVQDSIYDEFVKRLVERTSQIRLGNPLDMETEMGTVAFEGQHQKVLKYIEIGKQEGATVLYGGKRPTTPELKNGFFVEPTIFGDVRNDMRIAQEEIFGPVVCIIRFKDEADALEIANDTEFGLAAAVWTIDVQRAHRLASKINAGTVWINNYRKVSYASPFGGFKASGIGRENGMQAVHEYTQIKSIWIDMGNVITDPFKIL